MKLRLLGLASLAGLLYGDVKLPALISDHMVLQRGVPVRIWGWADPGETITVSYRDRRATATPGKSGRWETFLMPLDGGAAADMTIAGHNRIEIHDVLVGEVWLASGQSNMVLSVERANDAANEEAHAQYPSIRLFHTGMSVAEKEADDVRGAWETCSPDSVKGFSAVGYFFGRELHRKLGVPVGIIESAVGGTPVEAWTSQQILADEPALHYVFEEWQARLAAYPEAKQKYDAAFATWQQAAKNRAAGTKATRPPAKPPGPGHPWTPSGLYNGMIAPLAPYAIRGVLWYQGENNARDEMHAAAYERAFPLMIENWRTLWREGPFPFLFVQLPNLASGKAWPTLRESQASTLELRNTGMAVSIDVGQSDNIHPTNKQDVGHRLALVARATVYGEKIEYSGPQFRQAIADGPAMRVWFDHAAGMMSRDGGPLKGFEIAGPDGVFVTADARVEGGTVLVADPKVAEPQSVRYAWAANPDGNLVNADRLPAAPFRSSEHALEHASER